MTKRKEIHNKKENDGDRIIINVSGCKFETRIKTLNRYPETLLGNETSRQSFYDPLGKELLLNRDANLFNYILFFYQSNGILSKPEWATDDEFTEEISFFVLQPVLNKNPKLEESHPKEEEGIKINADNLRSRMTKSYKLVIWKVLQNPESSKLASYIAKFNLLLIILSTIIYCLETVKALTETNDNNNNAIFFVIESGGAFGQGDTSVEIIKIQQRT
eukprot:gene12335-13610_t